MGAAMILSPNFTLAEFTKSQTALRNGIDNSPDEPEIDSLRRLTARILQPVRDHFGRPVRISSGFRCLELNSRIGSKPKSQHVTGHAADIEIPGISNFSVAQWIQDHLDFDQLILEFWAEDDPSAGWDHLSFISEPGNRNQALTVSDHGTKPGLVTGGQS